MCTGVEPLLMGLSLASTAAGTVLNNRAAQNSAKNYNNQVNAQNRLLEQQYADRQNKIYQAQGEQAKAFTEQSAAQEEEFKRQTEFAKKKQQAFEAALQQPQASGATTQNIDSYAGQRGKLFADMPNTMPGSFATAAPTNESTEDRVLRESAEKSGTRESAKSAGVTKALAQISGAQDATQAQGALFRDLGTKLNDVASDSAASSNLLSYKLRPVDYRMNALGNVIGQQVNTPYFRGQEPIARAPNSTIADVFSGLGNLGTTAVFRGIGQTAKPWINPDLVKVV